MLNRLLFLVTITLAIGLILLVLLAPYLLDPFKPVPLWLNLFAHDLVVRRTSLVCGIGLFVTAMVFFRKRKKIPSPEQKPRASRKARSRNTVGA